MAARRLVIVMLVLLFVSTLAAALVPAPDTGEEPEPTRTRTEPTTKPSGSRIAETVDAAAKRPATIRTAAGDQLALTVRSPRPEQVEIAGLGELEDVDPEVPARFDLLLAERNTYAVRLLGSNRLIARIEVAAPAREVSESRRRSGRSAGTSRSR